MVSFELTDEQKQIRDTVAGFAKNELQKNLRDCDEKETIPEGVVKKGWELGLLQSIVPEEYGGFGSARSTLTSAIALEELGYGDVSVSMHILTPSLFAVPVLLYGTDEQKKKYLPDVCGDNFKAATAAVMEPRMDFDASSLKTTAAVEGNEYVLNGEKCFVPLAGQSDNILVFAQVSKGAGYSGVDGFIVPKKISGVKVSAKEKNLGLKALETNEITLKDVHVPKENKLGGDRRCDYLKLMDASRIALSSLAVGMARAAYDYSREYAKQRMAFGEPIASRQAIAFMLAEMAIEIDATRLLVWEAAWKLDRGDECTKEAYLAKRYAADMVMKVSDRAVQILGGHGYIREYPVELYMRNARGFATFEGMVMV